MSHYVGKLKKRSLAFNSSSRATSDSGSGSHRVSQSSRHTWTLAGSRVRKSSVHLGGSGGKPAGVCRIHRASTGAVRVLDNAGKDVTPVSLYHTEPGGMQSEPGRLLLDEIFSSSASDHSVSTSSGFKCTSRSSRQLSTPPYKAPLTNKTDVSPVTIHPLATCDMPKKRPNIKQQMLEEVVDICLSETDNISLLDMPSIFVSEDADDAEAIKETNNIYAELCKNRPYNDEYVEHKAQTFSGKLKHKETQSDNIVMVDKGTIATVWDIYDSFCNPNEIATSVMVNYPESTMNTSKGEEKREINSSSSAISTGSTIVGICGNRTETQRNIEPDTKQILLTESFQHSLLIMERNIVANIFQPTLADFRQLPILKDPDSMVKPENEEQSEEDGEISLTPTLEHLWAFSCEITKGCNVTSMAWNKKNPDLLAVGYGELDSKNQRPGFICCWSLKNPTWPERIFHCHSCVTSLDFSANNPSQLAVGMFDGTVAIYNVQCQDNSACMASSSECSKKHLHPVWQVIWTKQEMQLSGDEMVEKLVSVSADGRITKWLPWTNGLDCTDLMKLQRNPNSEEVEINIKAADDFLLGMTPCLCIDFHPKDYGIYLVGTGDGSIHKCSFSNSQNFLDTYKNHISPVNHVEWCPFSPDVFLSCSSDWTIQLWKQGYFTPVLSFISTLRVVYTAKWSPKRSTMFAAINGHQLEIWDLMTDIEYPSIVHCSEPEVKMTTLLFATGTDCVLVGDSVGQVCVYKLKNLSVGGGKEVVTLEDIIHSAIVR